jgi:predicted peptidase
LAGKDFIKRALKNSIFKFLILRRPLSSMKKIRSQLLLALWVVSCFAINKATAQKVKSLVSRDTAQFYDNARKRQIPVAYYHPSQQTKPIKNQQIVILNHGYGKNAPDSYLEYSYIAEDLVKMGYFVVSIQHELPTDDLIPDAGKPQIVRRPFWERGAENIRFVIQELQKKYPQLDYKHITLIGHSNGGDMSMLFAHKYPEKVYKVISLDNRRMALPRVKTPKLYTLRSNDYPADEGVLPEVAEQKKYGITVQATPVNHNNMDNDASDEEKKVLLEFIEKYLKEK